MVGPELERVQRGLKSKAARGIAWTMTQVIGSRGASFVVFLVLARLLPPSAFGLFAYAQAFILVVQSISDNAVSTVIVQRKTLHDGDLDTIFWANVALSALLTTVGVLVGPALAGILREPELGPLLQVLSVTFLIAGVSGVQIGVLRRGFDFKAVAMRSVGGEVVGGIAGIAVALTGGGVWGLVVQRLVAAAVGSAILWARSSWRPRVRFSAGVLWDVGGFAGSVIGSRVLWVFSNRIDDFLIGYFLGPLTLGYYTIAFRITRELSQLLGGTMLHVALSTFSRLQAEIDRLRRGLLSALRLSGLVAIPVFLWLILLAEPLTLGLFGERWRPAAPVMRVLAVAGLAHAHRTIGEAALVSLGRPGWWVKLEFVRIGLMVMGVLVAVDYGLQMVAWAVVLPQLLSVPVLLALIRTLVEVTAPQVLRQNWSALVSALVMLGATALAIVPVADRFVPIGVAVFGAGVALVSYSSAMMVLDRQTVLMARDYVAALVPALGRRSSERG